MAKAAGEGASSPALTASSSKSVEEDGQREQQGAEKVEEKKQLNKKELEVTVSAAVPIKQVQETLSVTTELGNRGEEPSYGLGAWTTPQNHRLQFQFFFKVG